MLGFFPRKKNEAQPLLDFCAKEKQPCFFFEAANRLEETLIWLKKVYTIEKICIGKELSKVYETLIHGTGDDILEKLRLVPLKGEWCVFIQISALEKTGPSLDDLASEWHRLRLTSKQAEYVGHTLMGLPKNKVYSAYHKFKEKS